MNILGIHVGHDGGAALVRDGRIVADVAEERFTRVKHYCGLPIQALDYCLKSQQMTMADVDIVAVPSMSSTPKLNLLLDLQDTKAETTRPRGTSEGWFGEVAYRPPLYFRNFPLSPRTEIVHVEHHLAHAASAYYT